jgi:hypothetical protein
MKKLFLVATALVIWSATACAGAGGLNLGWDDCGGSPSTTNKTFACNTNVGISTLVGSFVAPSFVTEMNGMEVVLDLQSTGATLPDWWELQTTGCRSISLFASFDFTIGPFTCSDYWQGGAAGGVNYTAGFGGPNRARIKLVAALPSGSPYIGPIPEGTEVYAFKLTINHSKTVGTGACAGCTQGVCIVLNSIKIDQPPTNPNGNKTVTAPAVRNWALWQGGVVGDCYAATPAKNATWGSIKGQYRP